MKTERKKVLNNLIKVLELMPHKSLSSIIKLTSFVALYGEQISKEADDILLDENKYELYHRDTSQIIEALKEIEPIKLLYIIERLLEFKIDDYHMKNNFKGENI